MTDMDESADTLSIEARAGQVRKRVAEACARSRRSEAEIGLVAVSKKFSPDDIYEAHRAGFSVFGESRVQEALQKIPDCPGSIEWHFIGRLQRNKVRPVVLSFSMIHSIDSLDLLERIDAIGREEGPRVDVCLQVNVAGEASKAGVSPDDAAGIVEQAQACQHARLVGLMTMPPFAPKPEAARPYFAALRELRDDIQAKTGLALPELSMGMSHDFDVAIEEGATWVRLGTAIFGKRVTPRNVE